MSEWDAQILSNSASIYQLAMITFTAFPPPKDSFGYTPAKFVDDEDAMDVDFDDDEEDFDSGSKLTCPGEPITSSHAYMRFVPSYSSFYSRSRIL
jgi:hypothetical protein